MVFEPCCKAPYQVRLTTDTAAQPEGIEPWIHILELKKAPPDIWPCRDASNETDKEEK